MSYLFPLWPHLQIAADGGDTCEVRVLPSPIEQVVGELNVDRFPCDFTQDEVFYQHYGRAEPRSDRISLQVHYETRTTKKILPIQIEIEVLMAPHNLPNERVFIDNQDLLGEVYPIFEGSPPFDRRFLSDNPKIGMWPKYGKLVFAPVRSTCDDFVNSGIFYRHSGVTGTPDKDHQPLLIEIEDKSGFVREREWFDLQINIRAAPKNEPPNVDPQAELKLYVDQLILTAITRDVLFGKDYETDSRLLVVEFDDQPKSGFFVSTDDRTRPILHLKLDPTMTGFYPSISEFTMKTVELLPGSHSTSKFQAMETSTPFAMENNGLILYEGSRRCIGPDELKLSDKDTPIGNLNLRVIDGNRHGQIYVGPMAIDMFSGTDIESCSVVYEHDDSDTFVDNIIMEISDGEASIEILFPIWIVPIDDQPPQIVKNLGAEIYKNSNVTIDLEDVDIDSHGPTLYTLQNPLSKGELFVLNDEGQWTVTRTFTSEQVQRKQVEYMHNAGVNQLNVEIEELELTASDTRGNTGLSFNYTIFIHPRDDDPPRCNFYPCTLGMRVNEYETAPLRKSNFNFVDNVSPPEEVVIDIRTPPHDVSTGQPMGRLLGADTKLPLTQFTQQMVNHLKVVYEAPNSDLGLVRRVVEFSFHVSDAMQNTLYDQTFTIELMPMDNAEPIVTNMGLQVMQGEAVTITQDKLDVTDMDTSDEMLAFMLLEEPAHGELRIADMKIEVGYEFTKLDIVAGDVSYANNGDDDNSDIIRLEVTDGMHSFPVNVDVVVIPRPVVPEPTQRNPSETTLVVPERSQTELTLAKYFLGPPEAADKDLSFTIVKQPEKGQLLKDGLALPAMTQPVTTADMANGRVVYQHNNQEIGPEEVQDLFILQAQDIHGRAESMEIITHVRIIPVDNQFPLVTVLQSITVDEGSKTSFNPSHLEINDADTSPDDIICRIDPQPEFGFLENVSPLPGSEKSRAGEAITDFRAADLPNEFINYVQSIHKGYEPTADEFWIRCRDKQNNESIQKKITVIINPVNDEEPKIEYSRWRVREGDILNLDESILNCRDLDIPFDELTFIVTSPPKFGKIIYLGMHTLESTESIDSFTCEQLRAHEIAYEHDDSENFEDSIKMQLTDGKHVTEETIPIDIIPVDDETPRVEINRGLQMEHEQRNARIGADVLKVTDLDSVDEDLMIIITHPPRLGTLRMDDGSPDGRYLSEGDVFEMRQLWENRVIYKRGEDSLQSIDEQRDYFVFEVNDGLNRLIDRKFFIQIESGDKLYPMVFNEGLTLPEDGRRTITTALLQASDLNSNDLELTFKVNKMPIKGHLESTDSPGKKRTTFTMRELVGSKIRYVHTADDEIRMDAFEFSVSDGTNTVYRTFRVNILPIDNKLPVVKVEGIRMNEGSEKLISPFEVSIEDQDTDDSQVRVTIIGDPIHGSLNYDGSFVASEFTLADLKNNKITYKHDGSESTKDQFRFIVTDGTHDEFYLFPELKDTHRGAVTFPIDIVPVDDEIPKLVTNKPGSYVQQNADGTKTFTITKKHLRATDRDSFNPDLKYKVKELPKHGRILKALPAQMPQEVDYFTQKDIDDKAIRYSLNDDVSETEDFFIFDLVDQGGNKREDLKFICRWSFVSLAKEMITVDEADKELIVTVKRRGYLGETAFVSVNTNDILAEKSLDFKNVAISSNQVQLNPGQTDAVWKIRILDDDIYEEAENFEVQLSDPIMTILEDPSRATVEIIDPDDESTVFLSEPQIETVENVGILRVPIQRVGDVSMELAVICSTVSGSAGGTGPIPLESFFDFISRPESHQSVIRFGPGQKEAFCEVTIIDDSLYEPEEEFTVVLSQPTGGRIDEEMDETKVVILKDPADIPICNFNVKNIDVEENVGQVEFEVLRTGSDLTGESSVIVRSNDIIADLKYHAAEAGSDYVAISKVVTFEPEAVSATVTVTILDDLGNPVMEGLEQFELYLSMPEDCVIGEPKEIKITIDDREDDKPSVEFQKAEFEVSESEVHATALIIRQGDLNQETTVRCYTRQIGAEVAKDYIERPNTDVSIVRFVPGQTVAKCDVELVNDQSFENTEDFRLVLGTPLSPVGAKLGEQFDTLVNIKDDGDQPTVGFEKPLYEVVEPAEGNVQRLRICVVRTGDLAGELELRVHTKDGNADSGLDYIPLSKMIKIERDDDKCCFEVDILHDKKKEIRESFTVWIKDPIPENGVDPDIVQPRTIVYIKQRDILADVTFPTSPKVISLADYDKLKNAAATVPPPKSGYPVICVTPCDLKSDVYDEVLSLCEDEQIANEMTEYRWQVSAPSDANGATHSLQDVSATTFMTTVNQITLDSIYFGVGSRIQCHARAVKSNGEPGRESASEIVTISDEGICPPRQEGVMGADPFSAKIRYIDGDDDKHSNTIKVSIVLPHTDGIIPLISTKQLTNFEFTMSEDSTRSSQHSCSNLLLPREVRTNFGFLTNATSNPKIYSDNDLMPYQFDRNLRSERTLQFYKNLNLEACIWEFESWYDMSELQQACGGEITTDGQVLNLIHSYVTLSVPLYVSYISHSPTRIPWRHFDLETNLRLTFVYDTAKMWTDGIGTPPESSLPGTFYPTSMKIQPDGRLVVRFKTVAQFTGMFVLEHPGSAAESTVTSVQHPELTFTLNLIRSDKSFSTPEQQWSFVSNYAITDYSGDYKISLIPCTVSHDQTYSDPPKCNPRDAVEFALPLRAQQVSDPVAEQFSLNTTFSLLSKKDLWTADSAIQVTESSDVAFPEGAQIYGRVQVDPVQSLGAGFTVNIEKVFLCSGSEGYIPKYNPGNSEYGCLADSHTLMYRFKVIDKEQPDTEDDSLNSVPFNAVLAVDDPSATTLSEQPGADGFRMDSTPLFQVNVGAEWYLHTIYTVRSSTKRVRRHSIVRRAAAEDIGVGFDRGTNMMPIRLMSDEAFEEMEAENAQFNWMIILAVAGVLFIALFVLVVFRRRNDGNYPTSGYAQARSNSDAFKPIVRPNQGSDSSHSSIPSGTEV
ncbi:unnamed protein product [Oikopleura dioica]|uniref:Calx-beta domain-containing protein n=1 Tax=Oikopleura dioica TaxID=34765 RepID=E4XAP5_OIKDI|nr:unnamed protein product [Oikopleura dioica]